MIEVGIESLGRSVLEPDGSGELRIAASRCPECGDVRFPRREFCVNDGLPNDPVQLAGTGVIYEAVFVGVPPGGFDEPFWAGYIDLDEGVRLFAQIARADGEDAPTHGQRVEMQLREIGVRPVLAPVFVNADGGRHA